MIKFSIVIPAYNSGVGIEKTVRSALNQSRTVPRGDFEVIVVNNNSTDNTAELAKAAGADKVVTENRQGPNQARNRGFLESTGEIIAFLDADCEAPENWLLKIDRVFNDPKIQACGGPYDYGFTGFKALGDWVYTQIIFPLVIGLLTVFKPTAILIGGNFAVRRSALENIGGIPTVRFWGDDAMVATLIRRIVGEVAFRDDIKVKSSHARFNKDGFVTLALKYAKAFWDVWRGVPKHPQRKDIPQILDKIFTPPLN